MTNVITTNGRKTVRKTTAGIALDWDYEKTYYIRDGEYPEFPKSWEAVINDYGTTEKQLWWNTLIGLLETMPECGGIVPYRTVNH